MCVQSALYICAIVIWVQHQKHYSDCPELLKCYYCCWLSRAVPFLLAIHTAMDTWGSSNGIASSMQIPGSIYVEQHGSFILISPSCCVAFCIFLSICLKLGFPNMPPYIRMLIWISFSRSPLWRWSTRPRQTFQGGRTKDNWWYCWVVACFSFQLVWSLLENMEEYHWPIKEEHSIS